MNLAHLQQLDRAVRLASRPRALKLLSQPAHLVRSKIFEFMARRNQSGIETVTQTFWAQPIRVVLPERVSMTIFRYGFFEAELSGAFIQILRPGMVFLDIGAHIGYFSLLASELVGPQGQVHTFEPTPTTFSILQQNTRSQSNITLVNAAVYSQQGPVQLRDFGVTFSAFNSIYAGKMQNNERRGLCAREYTAQAVTLAQYIVATKIIPNVIKIDAEGAELSILKGLEPVFDSCRPILTLEVGDTSVTDEMPRSRAVVDWVLAHGYRLTEFLDGKFVPHRPLDVYRYTNLVCFPE